MQTNGRKLDYFSTTISVLYLSVGMQLVCTCYFESRHVRYASYCFALRIIDPFVRHLI